MANIITAGNSTNGGTSVTTDTSGALNIVTGSGSGSNAITIDASQNVTVAGTLAGSSSITGTNLFGQGQTWQSVIGSRSIGTTYTNSTSRPILVFISFVATTASATGYLLVNGVGAGEIPQVVAGAAAGGVYAIVPPSGTYVFTTTIGTLTKSFWAELR